ncbi:MAG: HAD family phosphatase [Candidatus Magasanikbacteria bacterium]|nr:HAD family phosphatase [Candidatus Magasanikbacteria bacterium]
MPKLIIFDVDGVLLDNKLGGFKELLIELGKEKEVKEIADEYQKRKNQGPWGLEELANLFAGSGINQIKSLAHEYCEKKLMYGAKETIAELEKRKIILGAISSNPQILLDELKTILSLDFVEGTRLNEQGGFLGGEIERKVDRFIKAEILQEKIKELNLSKEDVVVVGDSLTDVPMSKLAGKFIVFNCSDEKIKQAGNVVVDKKDLREILYAIS